MGEVAKVDLSKSEAKSLTDKIRKSVDGLWALLLEAYERKAWKALEYKTWESYVKAEFDMSRRRSYQLVDQGRVIRAIKEVTGENVQHVAQISARDVDAVKDELPTVTTEIESRISQGETPDKAVSDVVSERRAEKQARGKKPDAEISDDEWRRQQEEMRASYSPELKAAQEAAEAAKAANKAKPGSDDSRIDDLERVVVDLENENAKLKAELKTFEAMRLEYERGGFAEVIAGLGEQIRVLKTRVSAESREKVKNLNTMEFWKKEAIKLGYSRDTVLSLDEPVNG